MPLADLDAFGFSDSVVDAIGPDGLNLVQAGSSIPLATLVSETDVSIADLLRFSLVGVEDL